MKVSNKLNISILKALSVITFLFLFSSCSDDDSIDSDDNIVVTPPSAAYDLELTLNNYINNDVIASGDVNFEFLVKNVGETTIPAGTNVYISLIVNEINQFDLTLADTGNDAATPVLIENDLAVGDSFSYEQEPISFLNVESTLAFLGITSAKVCSVVWGIDEASVGTFETDANSEDNTFCLTFGADETTIIDVTNTDSTTNEAYDLELVLNNYSNNEVINSGDVNFEFLIKNVGNTTIPAGSNAYVSLVVNNVQFDLDLVNIGANAATAIEITNDLSTGEYISYEHQPISFLNAESTLGFLGVTSAEVCSVVWGINEASIGTYETDSNSEDNSFCLNFVTE